MPETEEPRRRATLRSFLGTMWRAFRGLPATVDCSPFLGDYESWRQQFVDLNSRSIKEARKIAKNLGPQTSLRVVIEGEQGEAMQATLESLKTQILPPSSVQMIGDNGSSLDTLARKEWALFVKAGDVLLPQCLLLFAWQAREKPEAEILYADEEYRRETGALCPFMKPAWSPELFESTDYLGITAMKSAGDKPGQSPDSLASARARTLGSAAREKIIHIPHVLVQRVERSGSSDAPQREKLIQEFHSALGLEGATIHVCSPSTLHVQHPLPRILPQVSIIIPSRDRVELLSKCIESILAKTGYNNYEIILVDNDSQQQESKAWFAKIATNSKVRVFSYPQAFNFAAINNFGAKQATGEILLFLNDDTAVISATWLEDLVRLAIREPIGAVGALLYYPDDTIQHAGVVCGISRAHIAGHLYRGIAKGSQPGAAGFDCLHNYSAVTGACIAVRRDLFEKIDGFDERFSICYNDVDFCLRLLDLGVRNVWTPHATLYHYEHISVAKRNVEQAQVYDKEANLMRKLYGRDLLNDPAFSPNFALDGENETLANQPRSRRPW